MTTTAKLIKWATRKMDESLLNRLHELAPHLRENGKRCTVADAVNQALTIGTAVLEERVAHRKRKPSPQ